MERILIMRYCRGKLNLELEGKLDFKQFIFSVLSFFNPKQLSNTLSLTTKNSLLERQYQMEFYRIGTAILGDTHFVSPDVGRSFHSDGWLDFYVNKMLEWAIELTRDGKNIKNHLARFGQVELSADDWVKYNGKSLNEFQIKQKIFPEFDRYLEIRKKEWIILDFNYTENVGQRHDHPNVWRIFFREEDIVVLMGDREDPVYLKYK